MNIPYIFVFQLLYIRLRLIFLNTFLIFNMLNIRNIVFKFKPYILKLEFLIF